MPQVLEFTAATGLTITAKRFAIGSDTLVDSVTAVEKTNDKNRYVATFATTLTGAYRLNGFVGSVGGFANEIYDLSAADQVFLPRSEVASPGEIAAKVVAALAGVTIQLSAPIFSGEEGEDLTLIQGDDYVSSPVRIDIESSIDLTAYSFVIAARLQSNTSTKLGLRMQIQSDGDGQFAMFAPTAEQTESWIAGTYELRHRIEYAANKYKTIKSGILSVLPFDTPTSLIDVNPPA